MVMGFIEIWTYFLDRSPFVSVTQVIMFFSSVRLAQRTATFRARGTTQHIIRSASRMSTPAGQVISDVARAGDHATAREMQSEVGKQRNFEQAAEHVGAKMQAAPETITQEVRITNACTDNQS